MKVGFDAAPVGIDWGWGNDGGVVATDEDGVMGGEDVAEGEDGEVVVSVVVVGAGLTSEAHAGERAELSFDISFEVDVEIDEFEGDGEAEHFEFLEEDGFSVLRLVKGGVVVGDGDL